MLDPDISTTDALALLHRAETDPDAIDRRRFLQLVGMGLGAGLVAGSGSTLLDALIPGHDPAAWAAGPIGPNDGILVVIGMYGGNDALNMIVPVDDGAYYDMHGSLAIPAGDALPIGGGAAFNPALTNLHQMWSAGDVAVIEGVGYENPDLSHFNSMAYWMAGRPNALPANGWLGRWLDGYLAGQRDLYAATEIGSGLPLHLVGAEQRGTSVPPGPVGFGSQQNERSFRQYDAIRAMRTSANGAWFGSVGQAFVDVVDLAATLAPVMPSEDELGDVEIVAKLDVAARLINANLGFRVVTAGWGDFDSHARQPYMHTTRMGELDAAIARFFSVLDPAWRNRVTIMTFSEFGRTPWSNDGAGTDHGTSAAQLVIGANVRGGLYGERPTLAGLERWDRMAHHVDFRSYYASILDGWLGGGSTEILGGTFEDLGLFAAGPGEQSDDTVTPIPVTSAGFEPLAPKRILDTRSGLGAPARKLAAGQALRIAVSGQGGVPRTGVQAVIATVTAVEATEPTFFSVYPGGSSRPTASNLNARPGRPVPNLVVTPIGRDGTIEIFNNRGQAHCLVDVCGYTASSGGDRFVALQPKRLFDSRTGLGLPAAKLGGQRPVDIQVTGRAGVPTTGVTAVVVNLTATDTESAGFLRLTPTGRTRSATSNVNFAAGDTVPNLAICQIGSGGRITLDANGTGAHVIGDVFGYFTTTGGSLRALPPYRVLDSRTGVGATAGRIGPGRPIDLVVAGRGGVPSTATAVIMNLTATNVASRSFVTVWPAGAAMPTTSNLNVVPGRAAANLVICRVGAGGSVSIASPRGECDVVGDVMGYFVA